MLEILIYKSKLRYLNIILVKFKLLADFPIQQSSKGWSQKVHRSSNNWFGEVPFAGLYFSILDVGLVEAENM